MSAKSFPGGFLWGASTSSHQIEGDNKKNDWWEWESAGKTAEPSEQACDSYRKYEEDFDLARQLGQNAHRFSVEWSRIEPEEGQWNEEALRHYRSVLKALRDRGLEPVVTLHHFTNPLWLKKHGGWESAKAVFFFHRFCQKVVEAAGDQVVYWVTINEPTIFGYKGYIEGAWPPGKRSLFSLIKVLSHMAQAHCGVYKTIHQTHKTRRWAAPRVSIAHHMMAAVPCRKHSPRDRFGAFTREIFNNRFFLRLVQHSSAYWPAFFFGTGGEKRCLDFIGLNYYLREVIVSEGFSPRGILGDTCRRNHDHDNLERNDMDWEIYPEGLYTTLMNIKRLWHIPVMITENGIPTHDESKRARYIKNHLESVHRAIQEGVRVTGYMHWSLLDNFEWSVGYSPRFGLVHVDRKTQKRTIKEGARYYAGICKSNQLND